MYLLIQNAGEAPIEAYTLLGMSEARNSNVSGVIGKFGSGTKHAINLLLRKGIAFHVFTGESHLLFYYRNETIKTAHGEAETRRVHCLVDGTRVIECGWVLDFGAMDWDKTHMALREFVSNALDCTRLNDDDTGLEVREQATMRPQPGQTRVYVEMTEDVRDFYENLGFYFLHFSNRPDQVQKRFLDKSPDTSEPIIYREGVYVRTVRTAQPAVYDYNFQDGDMDIDECRNSSEYSLRATIARTIGGANADVLETLFDNLQYGECFEGTLDNFWLGRHPNSAWKEAWQSFAGDAIIARETNQITDYATKKGHAVKVIHSASIVDAAAKNGVPTVKKMCGEGIGDGKLPVPPTGDAQRAVDTVWRWCENAEMTKGKEKPKVECFKQLMDAGAACFGYYAGTDTVYIRDDMGGKIALKVAIEEVAHYITGASDNSRDFQNFAFELVVEMADKLYNSEVA